MHDSTAAPQGQQPAPARCAERLFRL